MNYPATEEQITAGLLTTAIVRICLEQTTEPQREQITEKLKQLSVESSDTNITLISLMCGAALTESMRSVKA